MEAQPTVEANAARLRKPWRKGWLTAALILRGIVGALSVVGLISYLGPAFLQDFLTLSQAVTQYWTAGVIVAIEWLDPYLPFELDYGPAELNFIVFVLVLVFPAYLGQTLSKGGWLAWIGVVGTLLIIPLGVIAFAGPGDISLAGAWAHWVWIAWTVGVVVILIELYLNLRTYFVALVSSLAVILTLEGLYYTPTAQEWIRAATEWLHAQANGLTRGLADP
jgi:hypothetical protein